MLPHAESEPISPGMVVPTRFVSALGQLCVSRLSDDHPRRCLIWQFPTTWKHLRREKLSRCQRQTGGLDGLLHWMLLHNGFALVGMLVTSHDGLQSVWRRVQ